VLCLLALLAAAFSPHGIFRSTGPAANGLGDVTLSPLSGGTNCSSCHSGGSFTPVIQVVVTDLSGNPVSAYTPGQTYMLGVQVSGGTRKGFQLVALRGANLQAGSFSAPQGGSQLITLSGRTYFEHNTPSASGMWAATWTAPPSGQGTVTFYFSGLATNFNGATSGDNAISGSLALPVACSNITTSQQVSICQGQSFTVGSSTYTSSGSYTNTFPRPGGCDSIVNTQLTVHPVYNSTLNVQICQGESYSFNGNAYNSTTTQTALFSTIHSCDSNVTLNLSVVPLIQVNQSLGICQGDTLHVGNSAYTLAGNYTDTLTASGGCDSVVHTMLSINQPNSSSVSASVCQGQSYILGNNTYTASGTYQAVLQNAAGCDSSVTLQLLVHPLPLVSLGNDTVLCPAAAPFALQTQAGYSSYSWTGSNSTGPEAQVSTSGIYSVTVSDSNGCSTTDAIDVQFSSAACLGLEYSNPGVLRMYPNPLRDILYIEYNETLFLEIFDSGGRCVFRNNVYQQTSLAHLQPGIYYVKARSAQGIFHGRFIRE